MNGTALRDILCTLTAVTLLQASVLPATASAAPAETADDASKAEPPPEAEPAAGSDSAPADSTATEADPDAETPAGDEPATDDPTASDPPADTEPSSPNAEEMTQQQAASLFREGSMFYELGQYEDAIKKFEAAWKLAPVPQLLFNLGQAHRRWYEMDPNIDHLREARTFFVNYDSRMKTDSSYSTREADYVKTMIEKLDAQIELEVAKEAERNRVIVNGPSAADIEALEKRRIQREKQLAASRRLNGAGIGLIVVGSVAAAVGVGGILARTAYKVVLDNSSTGDPDSPTLATADEDRSRRDGFLLSGQVGFGGLIAAAVFLPIGIGLRVGGGILEKRALAAGAQGDPTVGEDKAPRAEPAPKVAFEPTAGGIALHF